MAQGWAGFSEEELRRLKQRKDPFEPQRRLPAKRDRQQLPRERAPSAQNERHLGVQHGGGAALPEQLPPAPKQNLCPQPPHSPPPVPASTPALPASTGDGNAQDRGARGPDLGPTNSHEGPGSAEVRPPQPDGKLETKKVELQEKSRWEVLQQEQRLMEEKNKRKKALLAKAIAERSRRTQAETLKLKRIQKELQALDDMVSADIGILRNRIDQASLEYSAAR
ncbi:RAB6-interacting golgin isoform X2 [Sorex araneus]|nr:RAB6-interacting golgin isoform X2 [Sorex araneus]